MAEFMECTVTRTWREWSIPVRSLGSLPEWSKLISVISEHVGVDRGKTHGLLEPRIEGEGDDQTLVLAHLEGPRTVDEAAQAQLQRALRDIESAPPIKVDSYTVRSPEWTGKTDAFVAAARAYGGFTAPADDGETVGRLAKLVGVIAWRDGGEVSDRGTLFGVAWHVQAALAADHVAVGAAVYRLEGDGPTWLPSSGAPEPVSYAPPGLRMRVDDKGRVLHVQGRDLDVPVRMYDVVTGALVRDVLASKALEVSDRSVAAMLADHTGWTSSDELGVGGRGTLLGVPWRKSVVVPQGHVLANGTLYQVSADRIVKHAPMEAARRLLADYVPTDPDTADVVFARMLHQVLSLSPAWPEVAHESPRVQSDA